MPRKINRLLLLCSYVFYKGVHNILVVYVCRLIVLLLYNCDGGRCRSIDLFSFYVLFSQNRLCNNTPGDCFFQISSMYAYVRMCKCTRKGQIPLGPQ